MEEQNNICNVQCTLHRSLDSLLTLKSQLLKLKDAVQSGMLIVSSVNATTTCDQGTGREQLSSARQGHESGGMVSRDVQENGSSSTAESSKTQTERIIFDLIDVITKLESVEVKINESGIQQRHTQLQHIAHHFNCGDGISKRWKKIENKLYELRVQFQLEDHSKNLAAIESDVTEYEQPREISMRNVKEMIDLYESVLKKLHDMNITIVDSPENEQLYQHIAKVQQEHQRQITSLDAKLSEAKEVLKLLEECGQRSETVRNVITLCQEKIAGIRASKEVNERTLEDLRNFSDRVRECGCELEAAENVYGQLIGITQAYGADSIVRNIGNLKVQLTDVDREIHQLQVLKNQELEAKNLHERVTDLTKTTLQFLRDVIKNPVFSMYENEVFEEIENHAKLLAAIKARITSFDPIIKGIEQHPLISPHSEDINRLTCIRTCLFDTLQQQNDYINCVEAKFRKFYVLKERILMWEKVSQMILKPQITTADSEECIVKCKELESFITDIRVTERDIYEIISLCKEMKGFLKEDKKPSMDQEQMIFGSLLQDLENSNQIASRNLKETRRKLACWKEYTDLIDKMKKIPIPDSSMPVIFLTKSELVIATNSFAIQLQRIEANENLFKEIKSKVEELLPMSGERFKTIINQNQDFIDTNWRNKQRGLENLLKILSEVQENWKKYTDSYFQANNKLDDISSRFDDLIDKKNINKNNYQKLLIELNNLEKSFEETSFMSLKVLQYLGETPQTSDNEIYRELKRWNIWLTRLGKLIRERIAEIETNLKSKELLEEKISALKRIESAIVDLYRNDLLPCVEDSYRSFQVFAKKSKEKIESTGDNVLQPDENRLDEFGVYQTIRQLEALRNSLHHHIEKQDDIFKRIITFQTRCVVLKMELNDWWLDVTDQSTESPLIVDYQRYKKIQAIDSSISTKWDEIEDIEYLLFELMPMLTEAQRSSFNEEPNKLKNQVKRLANRTRLILTERVFWSTFETLLEGKALITKMNFQNAGSQSTRSVLDNAITFMTCQFNVVKDYQCQFQNLKGEIHALKDEVAETTAEQFGKQLDVVRETGENILLPYADQLDILANVLNQWKVYSEDMKTPRIPCENVEISSSISEVIIDEDKSASPQKISFVIKYCVPILIGILIFILINFLYQSSKSEFRYFDGQPAV